MLSVDLPELKGAELSEVGGITAVTIDGFIFAAAHLVASKDIADGIRG